MGLLRRVVLGLVLTTSVLSAESAKDARERIRLERSLARAAHEKKDYPAFLAHSRRLSELAPRSVGAVYNVACAEALLGHEAEAAGLLSRLAAMGLGFDAGADPDFDRIKGAAVVQQAFGRLAENRKPTERSALAFTLSETGLITEGLAHDPKTGAFFVSSVRQRKVVRRDPSGTVRDFVGAGQDGLLAAVGLTVDPARRSLWVSSMAMPQMDGYRKDQEGESLVLEYDLDTGRLRRKLLPPVAGGRLADLAVGAGSELVVSDPATGRIYRLENDALRVLVDQGPLGSAQGLAFDPEGRLFVADYTQGPARVDLRTGEVRLLDVPSDAAVTGIDGLVWARGALVGIQNGTEPHRVIRLSLAGDQVTQVSVLERAHPRFDEPTLGVVVGDALFYVANSQYGAVRPDGSLDSSRLKEPVILELSIAP